VSCLDAPVSGGDIGAQQGTLAIMVGGDAETLEEVMPILQVIGKTITHIGGPGSGQVAKAANQIMVAAQMVAMSELLILPKKLVPIRARWWKQLKAGQHNAGRWMLNLKGSLLAIASLASVRLCRRRTSTSLWKRRGNMAYHSPALHLMLNFMLLCVRWT